MAYALGLKAIRRLCEEQNTYSWYHAKLSKALFKPNEVPVYEWVANHVALHHSLPTIETLVLKFPEVHEVSSPEASSYHVQVLENAYFFEQINQANIETSKMLKANPDDWSNAMSSFKKAINNIVLQRHRNQILDMGAEAPLLVESLYKKAKYGVIEQGSGFGWPYLDVTGGALPGDVVSIAGRPSSGKSILMMYGAKHNWQVKKHNVLFVSMEMNQESTVKRAAAMCVGSSLTQLKQGKFSDSEEEYFFNKLLNLKIEDEAGAAKLFIVNGNLAADIEEIYAMAAQLECEDVYIDGGYLCRNKNTRLDRYTRVAENCELMKYYTEDLGLSTFASWQFSREAAKKQKSAKADNSVGLEDIGYSDAIPQISSTVLGLFQEEGVETVKQKKIRVLKGREGEVGEFDIHWDFETMDFSQITGDSFIPEPSLDNETYEGDNI